LCKTLAEIAAIKQKLKIKNAVGHIVSENACGDGLTGA